MKYNIYEKPDPDICPEDYCFHWSPADSLFFGGLADNLDIALKNAVKVEVGCCNCTLGKCRRVDKSSDQELYSIHDMALKKDNLPWFYFIPSPDYFALEKDDEGLFDDDDVREYAELKKKYIQESEFLWGKEHWL